MKFIRVDTERIKANTSQPPHLRRPPVIYQPLQDGQLVGDPQHCNDLAILDRHGEIAAVIRYSPDTPMGGARVWIEALVVQVLDEGGTE